MAPSPREQLASLPPEQQEAFLRSLDPQTLEEIARGEWWWVRRPEQIAPAGDDWFVWLYCAGRGAGKLLSKNTPVPTPSGWRTLGDIQPGQQVYDEQGKPTRVLATYDDTPDKAYRLHFSDGTSIDACADHQWVTWTHDERKAYLRSQHEPDTTRFPEDWPAWRVRRLPTRNLRQDVVATALAMHADGASARAITRHLGVSRNALAPHLAAGRYLPPVVYTAPDAAGPQVRTTQQIIDTFTHGKRDDTNHCIPVAGPLELPERDLPVDPWLLGYWLGNGQIGTSVVTAHTHDAEYVNARAGHVIAFRQRSETLASQGHVKGLRARLAAAGVLHHRHVPDAYLWSSETQRRDLLAGLLDSDGYIDPDKSLVEFCSTKEDLADAVVHLARSLSQKPVKAKGTATLNGVDMGPKWRVTWRPTFNPFGSPRKRAGYRPPGSQGLRNHHRMIVRCEEIPPVPMRCLTVDSPHSLFLIGEGMIPTHNTRTGAEWTIEQALEYPLDIGGHPTQWLVIGETLPEVRTFCIAGPSGLEAVLQRRNVEYHYQRSPKLLITLKEHGQTINFEGCDSPDTGRGYNAAGIWLDEAAKMRYIENAWKEGIMPSLRANLPRGGRPRAIVTTTPKPREIIRGWIQRARAGDPAIHLTVGRMYDNAANLSPATLAEIRREYEGTTLGRQEIHGELIEEADGALWKIATLERTRVKPADVPELRMVVVGMDPAGTGTGDETGIVVAGRGDDDHDYVIGDYSAKIAGREAARKAWNAFAQHEANWLVYEDNYGKTWLRDVLEDAYKEMQREGIFHPGGYPPLKAVHAVHGKRLRAEPVAMRYEQNRVHHMGGFADLETQMTTWEPGEDLASPDRLDALVHAIVYLRGKEKMRGQIGAMPAVMPPPQLGGPRLSVGAAPEYRR